MCSFREQYTLATSHGVGRDDKVSDKLGKVRHSVRRTRIMIKIIIMIKRINVTYLFILSSLVYFMKLNFGE